jgi:hypothetical protein
LYVEHAHRTFKALTRDLPISGWVSRACAKHQTMHWSTRIPMLVAKDGDPLTTRPCPLIYYYEQLLEDMKHIVTHMFEPIHRTILTPIPEAQISSPTRKSRSAPTASSSSIVARQLNSILGAYKRKQGAKRRPLRPMNIFRNWPRTYMRATRTFPILINSMMQNSIIRHLIRC